MEITRPEEHQMSQIIVPTKTLFVPGHVLKDPTGSRDSARVERIADEVERERKIEQDADLRVGNETWGYV